MNSHDDFKPRRGGLSDRLMEDGQGRPLGSVGTWGADDQQLEDLAFNPAGPGHTDYRTPAADPPSEADSFWPSYQPYEPEIPPPTRFEPPVPPPAAYIPEPEPEPLDTRTA